MTELEKLDTGLEYCFFDEEVVARKENALRLCKRFNAIDESDYEAQLTAIKELFGSTGKNVYLQPNFHCDYGKNIHVGEDFLTNYNVTILDIAPVHIGDFCMIGPNTLITTVGHPLTPAGRQAKLACGKPVTIGDNVWIGGNCTILPGVTIGSDVVVAAGAVVTKDVPDHCVVAGVPAKIIKWLKVAE
ncbi:MAG: sugar O-acetyltransferase [Eubacteriales bacterium]|nr:sugar O-acetyltransferase [Eubacteriales bacterium]